MICKVLLYGVPKDRKNSPDRSKDTKQTNKQTQSTRENVIQQVLTKCFWTMQPSSTSNILQLVHLPKSGITARKKAFLCSVASWSKYEQKQKQKLANMKMCAGGRIIITCDHTQKNNREYAILI